MQLVASGVERERKKKGGKSRGRKYERREEEKKMRREVREQESKYGVEAKVRRNVPRSGVGADFLWR